jgi:hypothetical protein
MRTGIFLDSNEAYHEEKHIGSTSLKQMAISPAHFNEALNGPKKESKSFDEGQVVHSVLLEQSLDGFIKRPDGLDARTKEGKAKLAELEATGKKVIASDVFDSLERRLTAFVNSTESMKLYNGAEIEKSHYAKDPSTGLFIKCRPDIYSNGKITDLKTTSNMVGFERQIYSYGYHIQCGLYSIVTELTTGSEVSEFNFIVQEKSAPFGLKVFSFSKSEVDFCKSKARELLNRASVCMSENKFPSYDDVKNRLAIPTWVVTGEFSFDEAI